MAESILVVDDDGDVVEFLSEVLEEAGFDVSGATSGAEALQRVEERDFDLVLSDVEMPRMRGIELVQELHAKKPHQLVILITAFGSIQLAVQCLRAGATDFVTKPFETDVLLAAIRGALRERHVRREIVRLRRARGSEDGGLASRSPAMQRVLELARRAALSTPAVLLTGASGVGKGAVARYIHDSGPRAGAPFVSVNCAALPPPLVEAELFGSVRGAYTDSVTRSGLFQEARGGTLFLDEIGELPLESQPKLLRALETGTVRPVGATREVAVHARIIAATNVPLEERLRDRQFRPDLYYRLNVISIHIPPLCERREDIEELIELFLAKTAELGDARVVGISAEALRWLVSHPWPGNVRQLFNTLERAVALMDHDTILLADVKQAEGTEHLSSFDAADGGLRPLAEIEAAYVRRVLRATGGNVSQAARHLGIDRRTLQRKLSLG